MNWAPTNQRARIITRENNLKLINEKMDLNLNNPLNLENPEAFTDILATGQGKTYFFYPLRSLAIFEIIFLDDRVELLLQPANFVHYMPESSELTDASCLPETHSHHVETPMDDVIEYHEDSTINLEKIPTRFSFTCHICQKSFISETSYRKHEIIHNSKHHFKLR